MLKSQVGDEPLTIDKTRHENMPPSLDKIAIVTNEDKQKWRLDLSKKAKTSVTKLFTKEVGAELPIYKVTQWYVNLVLGDELIDEGLWPENAKTLFENENQHSTEILEKMAQIFRENLTPDGQEWEVVTETPKKPSQETKRTENESFIEMSKKVGITK
jgi:hypothetical protein